MIEPLAVGFHAANQGGAHAGQTAVAAGRVNLKGIVTDLFDFDDIQNAMDKSIADKASIVKAVVKMGKA